jgi:hypothetical protein
MIFLCVCVCDVCGDMTYAVRYIRAVRESK